MQYLLAEGLSKGSILIVSNADIKRRSIKDIIQSNVVDRMV